MSGQKWIPGAPEIVRESLIIIGGAVLAAYIIGQFPPVKKWISQQWGDTPKGV